MHRHRHLQKCRRVFKNPNVYTHCCSAASQSTLQGRTERNGEQHAAAASPPHRRARRHPRARAHRARGATRTERTRSARREAAAARQRHAARGDRLVLVLVISVGAGSSQAARHVLIVVFVCLKAVWLLARARLPDAGARTATLPARARVRVRAARGRAGAECRSDGVARYAWIDGVSHICRLSY